MLFVTTEVLQILQWKFLLSPCGCRSFSRGFVSLTACQRHLKQVLELYFLRTPGFSQSSTLKCKEYLNIHILKDISCSFPSFKILSWTTEFLLSHLITYIKLTGKKGICEEGAVMLVFRHSLRAWLRSVKLKPFFA